MQNNRQFYTDISLVDYNFGSQFGGIASSVLGGQIKLPLPRRINDHSTHNWSEISARDTGAQGLQALTGGIGSSLGGLASIGGAAIGKTVNPFMFMTYQRPGYKEHELSWLLSAANEAESRTLKKIIDQLKKAALPSSGTLFGFGTGGVLWNYPKIANISLKPDKYLFKFLPCAILSVTVDHTAAGTPSFHTSGAATVVGLTLRLKEINLWTQDNYVG